MGQTLVKVMGVVAKGDYILPSGRADGLGIAVSPSEIRVEQLADVVGVAWGHGGVPGRLGLVNVAVGLRPVEMTRFVAGQQVALESLREDYASANREIARLRSELATMQASFGEVRELAERLESMQAVRVAGNGR
jgi:hypothetical protein